MYDLQPKVQIYEHDTHVISTFSSLKDVPLLIVETYPGVSENTFDLIKKNHYDVIIETRDLLYEQEKLNFLLQPFLTDDRVRGRMCFGTIHDFIDPKKLQKAKDLIKNDQKILVYGVGASLLSDQGCLVYVDITRWEIQLRYRQGMPNYFLDNSNEDILKKFKTGYFVEWRIADKIKRQLFERMDYYVDATKVNEIKMIPGQVYLDALNTVAKTPFRLVPYFDPGVWGGDWMSEKFNLPENGSNYAWSFDGVPEENSINLGFGSTIIETPAINLVLREPLNLLGQHVYSIYGAEFPIRFDYLDTMNGQNLSLQVHPSVDLVRREFGLAYTQSESYYLLDSKDDGVVYLGVKENVDKEKMFHDLELANKKEISFEANKYVNVLPAKKHDHFLIPPGTIHCSGKNTVVLEISNTPYIFTFKLWDWDRLGLDGLPRPVHLELGKQALDTTIDTKMVEQELHSPLTILHEEEGLLIEKTGLSSQQTIETTRVSTNRDVILNNDGRFSMMNLVEGEECEIIVGNKQLRVHYGETFIVPASIDEFTIQTNQPIKVIRAQIRRFSDEITSSNRYTNS